MKLTKQEQNLIEKQTRDDFEREDNFRDRISESIRRIWFIRLIRWIFK